MPNCTTSQKTLTNLEVLTKRVREKSRECHNHKPQLFPDPKRKRKPTNLNKHKPNKRTKSTKISSLFPKRGNRNTKRTGKLFFTYTIYNTDNNTIDNYKQVSSRWHSWGLIQGILLEQPGLVNQFYTLSMIPSK